MKTTEEMLDEVENANNGDGPAPLATVDDPALARIAVAQIRLRAAERELDEAVMAARDVGLSWQAIGNDSSGCEHAPSRRLLNSGPTDGVQVCRFQLCDRRSHPGT